MNKMMNRIMIIALAFLFIGVFTAPSNAATLFYLYVPEGVEILKADVNVYDVNRQYSSLGVVLGRASIRLVYNRNGQIERYTLQCYLPNKNPLIPLPVNVEMYFKNINKPYVEYID